MTSDDEQFLTDVYQSLGQEAIGPGSPLYVSFESMPGGVVSQDAIPRLAREIRRSLSGTTFFLTGLRGAGKSSQLMRLSVELSELGFAVVMPDAEEYLDLRRPLDVTQMILFLVGGVFEQAADLGWIPKDAIGGGVWTRFATWLTNLPGRIELSELGVSGELSIPEVAKLSTDLKAELRGNPTFVKRLDNFLEGRQAELVRHARLLMSELTSEIEQHWLGRGSEWRGLVVIADSLDHNRAIEASNFHAVRRALANLFDLDNEKLTFPTCRIVFTLPSFVRASGASRYITNIRIADRQGRTFEAGVAALIRVLEKRVPGGEIGRIFESDMQLRLIVMASGGHLRTLLLLMTEVITQADAIPVDNALVQSAIEQVRNTLLPIPDDRINLLREVVQSSKLPLASDDEWETVAALLNERLILGYQNGEPWYAVHPLVADRI